MAISIEKLGTVYPEFVDEIDGDRAKAYAAATNDDNPAYTSGKYAPPVFAVVPAWRALLGVVGDNVPRRGRDDDGARRAGHALRQADRAGHDSS